MNTHDWIEFAKEKPKDGQIILALTEFGSVNRFSYCPKKCPQEWTHWQPWADPPKPDPFEEEYRKTWPDDPHRKAIAREFWKAALEWRRQNPK